MIKLLIVDDEPGICELIKNLIDWKNLGLFSLGSALSGTEALQIIQRQKPDIVITDIQMPGITGLELIERCREQPEVRFIVVSGYREFEYAQQAIKFGVEDYLLKPISKNYLNLVLSRLIDKKKEHQEHIEEVQDIQNQLIQKKKTLRKNELSRAIVDSGWKFSEDLFDFRDGDYLFVCVHASFLESTDLLDQAATNILESIGDRICSLLEATCWDLEYVIADDRLLLLMNYSEEDGVLYLERKNRLQNLLKELKVQYENLVITFAIGDMIESRAELGRALATVLETLNFRLLFGSNRVLEYRKIQALPQEPKCELSPADFQELVKHVTAYQADRAAQLVERIYAGFRDMESYDVCRLFELTYATITQLRSEIVSSGMRGYRPGEITDVELPYTEEEIYNCINGCCSIIELRAFFCRFLRREMDYCSALQQQKADKPIRLAQEFISKNLGRQISLEETAACACVSAGYLSTLFKEKTGINFSDYVINMRMEKAKALLCNTSMTIAAVADEVGYADYRHFSKVFQRSVGLQPTVYRKFYG